MSDSVSPLPARPSLQQLQKRAKDLLRQHRNGDLSALARLSPANSARKIALADAQFVIAREHGFDTWEKLKRYIEALAPPQTDEYDCLAYGLAAAHMSGDTHAVREINRNYSTSFVSDFHDPIQMHQRLLNWFVSESRDPEIAVADARLMIAHDYSFDSWETFMESLAKPLITRKSYSPSFPQTPPFYRIDWKQNMLMTQGPQSEKNWEAIIAVMEERAIKGLTANGISNSAVKRLYRLHHLAHFSTNSDALTDAGMNHLANMPQLVDLEISGLQITDSGLVALRHLTELRRFQSCWTQGISDAGVENLAFCNRLESVNLMGTATGDGLIRALAGKPNLRQLKTGHRVTDAGIKLLHQLPIFKTWHGGEVRCALVSAESEANHLLIDGPFTDSGLAELPGLDGLFGLSFFRHSPSFTSEGLKSLLDLSHLGFLGCEGDHCDDAAMLHIGALPHLQMLMGQDAVAGDTGWEALSKSQSIQYIWGRDCLNFGARGFAALSTMPALRGIGVSCVNVDDLSFSALPSFPALREIVTMHVPDAGFRHVGRCENLERLWCMYCRDTTDAATGHIAQLSRLKTYYAGMTQITDRSLEILGAMPSLESIELNACQEITDAGIAELATLPRLRELAIGGSPGVSSNVSSLFAEYTDLKYSP